MIPCEHGKISTVVISTALGQDGRGIFPYTLCPPYRRLLRAVRATGTTVLAKSATRFKRKGNFIAWNPLTWHYIRRLPDGGMLNAYGLTNAGAEVCARDMRAAGQQGFQVIPNLYPEFAKGVERAIQEALEALEIYRSTMGSYFWALELNYSCPNSAEEIRENVQQGLRCTREVRERYPWLCLVAKISICHPYEFAQELEALGLQAIHAVNTIPYEILFPPERYPRSPLWKVGGGGVSGGPAFQAAFAYNQALRKKVSLPLIMGCGIKNQEDVQRYLDIGADAVSFCTLALRHPREAQRIVETFGEMLFQGGG
jgi:dihydroorotate dehydrogenase (NAD+) catalytic subunit